MKSAANGGLNLSVLDGWWVEGYDGDERLGDRRRAPEGEDDAAQDARHAHALYDLLEQQVIPLFYDRDADGIPRALARNGQALAPDERPALLGRADGRGVRLARLSAARERARRASRERRGSSRRAPS